MSRPGPKGRSPEQQRAAGETRPSRQVVTLFGDHASRPDPEAIPPPKGMTAAARTIWEQKVDRYRQRGQKVQGFEDALRQYCELEAQLATSWKKGGVTMAMVNAHRHWAAEFFDTPAAQRISPGAGQKASNRFAQNGVRAAAAGV
jgi:hypothetical protein